MTREKSAYHHGDLRNALIEAATTLVQEVGAEQFSLRDAARAVGVSANATYRHFENKSALLTAVAAAGFVKLSQRMKRKQMATARANHDPVTAAVQKLEALGRTYTEFAVEQPEIFRVMFGSSGICRLLGNPLALPSPTLHELLGEVLDDLVRVGVLPTARRPGAEVKVWTVVHGFVSLLLEGATVTISRAQYTAALEDMLHFTLEGLCAQPRERAHPP
ncbi:TetR/AcrR family transcriptional regulator [Chondromyces crocatus]|uniref:Transcriptional regulator n=1 Tax=Chondromyces crocatus TaxID=52 RepID=A0A0K1EHY6_CHOCO|nr:TetR/AcrR family transcriptional regulator [Chondromyces crocatus]AKT40193.1 transcriptional regulator [Chondromyces crocatus]